MNKPRTGGTDSAKRTVSLPVMDEVGTDFDHDVDLIDDGLPPEAMSAGALTNPRDIADAATLMCKDLERSGLAVEDMTTYLAGMPELTACKVRLYKGDLQKSPGYVIPYYGYDGRKVPFYRIRMFSDTPGRAKYLQPPDSATYIYYPRRFHEALKRLQGGALPRSHINGFRPTVIICEGEKKAEKALQEGFLAVALGGVYNWKSRTLVVPDASKMEHDKHKQSIHIKLPSGMDNTDNLEASIISKWANGFQELIHMVQAMDMNIIILFDADYPVNPKVQVAAATLGFELRTAGIPISKIRQVHLPNTKGEKVALDDYLVEHGADKLEELLHEVLSKRTSFPAHPSMKAFVNTKLAHLKTREQAKNLAVALIADMDAKGARMKDKDTGMPYYFDSVSKALMDVNLMHFGAAPLHETAFGRYVFQNYDLSQADSRLLPWIASYFTGEEPVFNVQPRSTVSALPSGDIAYQLNDGMYALITPSATRPIRLMDNGSGGLLFKGGQVESPDVEKLKKEITKQLRQPWTPWWVDVLKEFKFQKESDCHLAAILFYISPWFLRWQGTQLPIELMIGEPGSGKSSMYMLRSRILTGRATLRNQPNDPRDWYSSITASDGLHITDNAKFLNKELRQRVSDEICRIITEPDPYIELRKLYTTTENLRLPVRSVFAFTAIQQPFVNADIIQRAAIFELNAVGGEHDNNWAENHMEVKGGREAWMAHHMIAVHKLLHLVKEKGQWDPRYKSKHRLVNYEQLLVAFGTMMGIGDAEYIRETCLRGAEDQVAKYDWVMEGLVEYAQAIMPMMRDPKKTFSLADVAEWAQYNDDYKANETLTNARRLAHYLKSHITMVSKVVGLHEVGKYANRMMYRIK